MNDKPYISHCPIGCTGKLEDSDIFLPEGCLKICPACSHLVSQCTETLYNKSVENEFDDSKGTWPTGERESRLARRTKKDLGKIERMLNKGRKDIRLLDVGCSNGSFIHILKKMGVGAEGVEPAQKAAHAAIEAGLKVHQGFIQDLKLPDHSFDVITLFEVIEHIKDPIILLKECHRLLRPKGIVFIRTGNTKSWTARRMKENWHYFKIIRHGGHISFFNPLSIKLLSDRTDFHIEKLGTHGVSFYNKEDVPYLLFRFSKIITEMIGIPIKCSGFGHDMEIFLRKHE